MQGLPQASPAILCDVYGQGLAIFSPQVCRCKRITRMHYKVLASQGVENLSTRGRRSNRSLCSRYTRRAGLKRVHARLRRAMGASAPCAPRARVPIPARVVRRFRALRAFRASKTRVNAISAHPTSVPRKHNDLFDLRRRADKFSTP